MGPSGPPPSVSSVSDLNTSVAPNSVNNAASTSGKKPGPISVPQPMSCRLAAQA